MSFKQGSICLLKPVIEFRCLVRWQFGRRRMLVPTIHFGMSHSAIFNPLMLS
jgi:hypothetical protein